MVGFTELRAMETAYAAFEPLEEDAQIRALRWLGEALGIEGIRQESVESRRTPSVSVGPTASLDDTKDFLSPREFISQKKPQSLVERIACLGYYLTHYRDTRHFKTPDIVALNTEAAAHKFGNPSRDVDNADRQNGYIVSAGKGAKQLTVRGEALVEALPDREAVKAALHEHPYKPKRSSTAAKKVAPRDKDES
ncbi:hypothetical protein [Plantactinospora sp. BC1]|uniref:hypothetical protein n=1 Tax=Plantactinospora sp. BC1 TaxID=2108470 RepID=UPI00131F2CB0|nr:hypothetical protein [Plantactinospora sp. BC1]